MPNNLFHHEMALSAARVEERDADAETSKIPFNGANSWDTNALNEIIAAEQIINGLLFVHAVMGSQLAW